MLVGGCRPNGAIPGCLSSKRLSVALGSDADRLARQWERRAPNLVRIVFDEDRAALAALNTQSDAALVDGREVWQELDALRGSNQAIVLVEARPYVLAARRSDGRLLAEINAILNAMQADGSLDGLSRKWLAPRCAKNRRDLPARVCATPNGLTSRVGAIGSMRDGLCSAYPRG